MAKITSIRPQVKNPDRVNVIIDGKYAFSLDILQITDLSIKIGFDYSEEQINEFKKQSEFGKVYTRTLNYIAIRLRSEKEIRDYLRCRRKKDDFDFSKLVIKRLKFRGYIDDKKFAEFWIANRHQTKGSSMKKLRQELYSKGIDRELVDAVIDESDRNDESELKKVLCKKAKKYKDQRKLIGYLMRCGFKYDDITRELNDINLD